MSDDDHQPHTAQPDELVGIDHNSNNLSQLLALPYHVRELIFKYLLISKHDVDWVYARSTKLHPAILLTCKEAYQQCARILYQENQFTFAHPSDVNIFVQVGGDRNFASRIQHVLLQFNCRDLQLWCKYISAKDETRSLSKDLPQLRHLVVRMQQNYVMHTVQYEAFLGWAHNPKIKHLCMALDGHTQAHTTIYGCIRAPPLVFGQVGEVWQEYVRPHSEGALRSVPYDYYQTRVFLDIVRA